MESQPSTFEYRFNKGSSAENIPFELNANKPYLQVRINGAGPYWFILYQLLVSRLHIMNCGTQ